MRGVGSGGLRGGDPDRDWSSANGVNRHEREDVVDRARAAGDRERPRRLGPVATRRSHTSASKRTVRAAASSSVPVRVPSSSGATRTSNVLRLAPADDDLERADVDPRRRAHASAPEWAREHVDVTSPPGRAPSTSSSMSGPLVTVACPCFDRRDDRRGVDRPAHVARRRRRRTPSSAGSRPTDTECGASRCCRSPRNCGPRSAARRNRASTVSTLSCAALS